MRPLILAAGLLLVAPGIAGAAPPPGDYGGGGAFAGTYRKGDSWMWARVGADGRAAARGCAPWRPSRVASRATRPAARCTGGSGSAGRTAVALCTTGNPKPWQLRQPVPVTGPGGPQGTTSYLGLTSEQGSEPRPFVLRVGRKTSRVAFAMFEYTRRCRREQYFLNNVTPGGPIRPDGTLSLRERFRLRYARVGEAERFRVAIDGRFAAGAVTGTVRVTTVTRRLRSRRVVDRCDTGPLTFSARV